MSPFSFSITSFTLTSFTVDAEEIPLPPVQRGTISRGAGGRTHTVKPVAVLITTKVYLKYRVTSLTTKTSITYSVKPEQKPLIKFGSAILKIVTRLFIPVKGSKQTCSPNISYSLLHTLQSGLPAYYYHSKLQSRQTNNTTPAAKGSGSGKVSILLFALR